MLHPQLLVHFARFDQYLHFDSAGIFLAAGIYRIGGSIHLSAVESLGVLSGYFIDVILMIE